jgi:hypothetical protein
MPYYFGEGDPGWDEYCEAQETEYLDYQQRSMLPGSMQQHPFRHQTPIKKFAYVEPWEAKTSVLHFPRNPPPRVSNSVASTSQPPPAAPTAKKPGILARIFRANPPMFKSAPAVVPEYKVDIGSEEWIAEFHAKQKRQSEEALLRVAVSAAALRANGVRRLFIRYDGGNDEGFTHFDALEMTDGRRLTRESAEAVKAVGAASQAVFGASADIASFEKYGYLETLNDAAIAFVGPGFGTGPFEMFGAITVDCEACTLTDEKDPARAFPQDDGAG